MPAGVCSETWILDHPQTLIALQRAYLAAGSEIIYAPTFGANRVLLGHPDGINSWVYLSEVTLA